MGFDKPKAIRAAEKYLAQGKIAAAITEYRRIAEQEAGDLSVLNTLGDLYARVDQKQEAVECFKRVADHYRAQGFAVKAIAMYKKIGRINPGDLDIARTLARLYEQQGLLVEARAQYLTVVDAHTRAGQSREALDVLRRIADLDPNNTEIRLRLGDGLVRENLPDSAAAAFNEAGDRFAAQGDHERALEAYHRALALRPNSYTALHGLVVANAALGTADEAAELLEKVVTARPDDPELAALLARAYVEAENSPEAERVTGDLVVRDAASYVVFFDVARLYLKQGEVDRAVSVVGRIVEPALAAHQETELLELLHEALARDPEQLSALNLAARVHAWQRNDDSLQATLERLAEAAEAAGDADEERRALIQLVRIAPAETRFRERLTALGGGDGAHAEAAPATGDLSTPLAATGEVPTFESFMLMDDAAVVSPTAQQHSDSTMPVENALEFEWNTIEAPPPPPAADAAHASFADLNESFAESAAANEYDLPASPIAAADEGPSPDFQEIDFGLSVDTATGATKPDGDRAPIDDAERTAHLRRQELESVDFYLNQGYTDIACDTLDMLERQYGAHPDIDARRQQLMDARTETPEAATPDAPPPSPASPSSSSDSLAAATTTVDYSGFALYDLTPEEGRTAGDVSGAEGDAVAAAPDAASTISASGSAPPPAPDSSSAPQPPSPAGIDPGLAAIFDEFRAAEEAEAPSDEQDYETHYNLGLAYKDIDRLDQAIEEFQIAVGLVAPGDGTSQYLQCCNLLGHCFMKKGLPRAAALWFKRGLDAPGHTEDEYQALRFELGTAYEHMGELERAIDVFSEVYGIDVSYRGVADKLRDLQAQRTAN